ncbi:MAG: methyltransferase domain-containing protein [Chloroflexi bacterium]|nr:methyltransferase domain-containing protein [Chloroflexota bacterium]
MSHSNAWSNPSVVSPADAAQMAAFLEDRSRLPDQAEINAALCDVLVPRPGERILEVGSGSGVLCRLIAPRVAPGGLVVGLDIAPDMAAAARRYADEEDLGEAVRFDVGPAEALPYPAASFDAVVAVRLLLHAADPDAAVREMARVTRPRGRVEVMDWDFDTVAVDQSDRALTRRIIHWRTDHHGGNNWSGRQLRGRLAAAGLCDLRVTPVVSVASDETSALTQSLWRAADLCRAASAITPAEHDAWVGELRARIAAGRFFASIVYFIVRGEVGA